MANSNLRQQQVEKHYIDEEMPGRKDLFPAYNPEQSRNALREYFAQNPNATYTDATSNVDRLTANNYRQPINGPLPKATYMPTSPLSDQMLREATGQPISDMRDKTPERMEPSMVENPSMVGRLTRCVGRFCSKTKSEGGRRRSRRARKSKKSRRRSNK